VNIVVAWIMLAPFFDRGVCENWSHLARTKKGMRHGTRHKTVAMVISLSRLSMRDTARSPLGNKNKKKELEHFLAMKRNIWRWWDLESPLQ
jgi:hypothetical protein